MAEIEAFSFELPDLPTDWGQCALREIGEVRGGRRMPKGRPFAAHVTAHPYIRVADMKNGTVTLDDIRYALPEDVAEISNYTISSRDIYITIAGTLGAVGTIPGCLDGAQLTENAAKITSLDVARVDQRFLTMWLASDLGQRQVAILKGVGGGVPKLALFRIEGIRVALPPLGEQRKIAAILSSVDDAIEATQAVIDQLQVVKKAMMAELLTRGLPGRHTRFKMTEIGEVPEEWEVVALSSVGHLQTGLAKGKAVEGGVELPYLRVANVQDGHVDLSEVKTICVDERSVERYRLRAGDVLFTEGGDADKLGRGCVWRGQIAPCLHQNHVFAVRPQPERLMPEFLSYWAASPRGKAYFLDCAKQTTNLASINSTQLKALPVPLPDPREQAAIVDALQTLEARLAVERAVAQSATAAKAALMSVLLTGEVRVKPDEVGA